MSFMSGLMWLIVLIIALANVDRGLKHFQRLGGSFIKPTRALLPATTASASLTTATPLKSENYVASSVEEQKLLAKFEEQLVDTESKSNAVRPVDMTRWNGAIYPPGIGISDSIFNDASRMILCSNTLHPSNLCTDVKVLTKDATLYGLKTSTRIIFGFKLVLETTPKSAALLRIKLHEEFKKNLWPAILRVIDFTNEQRELIFVGYDSGGALASLAAWTAIKQFDAVRPTGLIVKNGNNQVKVITWDELPLYTLKTATKSPLLPRNHSRFTSTSISDSLYRTILQSSGGIDEIQYFGTSGNEIVLNANDYFDFTLRLKQMEANESAAAAETTLEPNVSLHVKAKHLRNLSEDRITKLSKLLALHRQHLSIMHNMISSNYRSYLLESILVEPNSCANTLAKKLSNEIFPGATITCRIDGFDPTHGTFQILCSYKTANAKNMAQFLTFDAVLGDESAHNEGRDILAFMQEVEIEASALEPEGKNKTKKTKKNKKDSSQAEMVKVLSYNGPEPVADNWSNCLYDLFKQREHLSLISPFSVRDQKIYPQCSYLPFDSLPVSKNTGCYLRAPNVAHELLQVSKADPNFFYRAIDTNLVQFPGRCRKLLFHLPFKATERVGLEDLQQLSVDYLTELISKNPIADSEVTLWRSRDTHSFKTLAFYGSANISAKDLADRNNYDEDFENSIVKCLSSPSYPYRDCTNPLNRWVPTACPIACSQTHGSIDFLCKQVKSCPSAGYYIAVSTEGTIEKLGEIHSQLTKRPNPQFGIFHVQTRGRSPISYFATNFNVALFRLPSHRRI